MHTRSYETFPHDADVGVRGYGRTRDEAFANAALAMAGVVTDPARVAAREVVEITCESADDEMLLVDFLNAIIFEMATRRLVFSRFEVASEGPLLRARAHGEPVDVARHEPAVEVKGATLTELRVAREASGRWVAQCVVDV
jgi:SHS2 domain-containing protein